MPSHRATRADRRARDTLPAWDELSDLDKGVILRYLYRTSPPVKGHRGAHFSHRYWRKAMVCRFQDDPRLVALEPKDAARYARKVSGGQKAITAKLTKTEYGRLFLVASRRLG